MYSAAVLLTGGTTDKVKACAHVAACPLGTHVGTRMTQALCVNS